jgi:PAS domain S-box-containing protein
MLISLNIDGSVAYANQKVSDLLGYTKEELIEKTIHAFWHSEMPKTLLDTMWKEIHQHKEWVGVVNFMTKKQEHHWVKLHVFPTFHENALKGYALIVKEAKQTEVDEVLPTYKKLLKEQQV